MQSDEIFDYVVVGSGAAGSLLAARLAEDSQVTVCHEKPHHRSANSVTIGTED